MSQTSCLFTIERGEFYWNFYVVSLLALTGWLVFSAVSLTTRFRVLISAGYLALAGMNLLGLIGAYVTLGAIRNDLVALLAKSSGTLPHTLKILSDNHYQDRPLMAFGIHLLLRGLFLCVLWKRRAA